MCANYLSRKWNSSSSSLSAVANSLTDRLALVHLIILSLDLVKQIRLTGEWRGGVSPPRSLRIGREPLGSSRSQYPAVGLVVQQLCLGHVAPPVTGWPPALGRIPQPLRSTPLQSLHPYYGLLRPCAPHRYSCPRRNFPLELLP